MCSQSSAPCARSEKTLHFWHLWALAVDDAAILLREVDLIFVFLYNGDTTAW